MADDLRQLMLADITPDGPLLDANGPLASAAGWADAFHWNRLGLPARTQSILAWAARAAILDLPVAQPELFRV
jgi:hypothetical protein